MDDYLKLVGSIVIGAIVLMSIMGFVLQLRQTSTERFLDTMTSNGLETLTDLIEFDFNRLGMGVKKQEDALLFARADSIAFQADLDENGTVETISYALSDSTKAGDTQNPHDKILTRRVSGELPTAITGVTRFTMRYLDRMGYETVVLADIKSFEIMMEYQSCDSYDDYYSLVTWEGRISPPNIRRY